MKTSIKTIKFLVLLSVLFLLLTYCISLNVENKWIILNSPWLSNNFAFAVAGGTFASLVVILACELQKFSIMKRQAEDFIYGQLITLYSQIIIIHYNVKRQMNEISTLVPSNLIDEVANRGLMSLNCLSTIEYITFGKCNLIKDELNKYKGKKGMHICFFLQKSIFLKIAINEDKITMLKQGRDEIITANSPKTHLVLKKIIDDSSVILTFIEGSLDTIDKECKNRYNWNVVKNSVISFEEKFVSEDLDDYLKLPIIQLN